MCELSICIEMYNKNRKQDNEDNINMAIINGYYTEVFKRQDKKKKLPNLNTFLINSSKPAKTKTQSNEQMFEQVRALNALFGGKIIKNK